MTNRQRFINTALCKDTDRPPFFFYLGPWGETIRKWRNEGLDRRTDWRDIFGFDPGIEVVKVNLGYSPEFEKIIIEEKETTLIIRDECGITMECRKSGSSIPRFIDYPIKTADDWESMKRERLDPDDPNRFPENWIELADNYNNGEKVIQLGSHPYGLFGTLRDMMGLEELAVAFHERPELIRDMMDYLTDFWLSIYKKVCGDVKVDMIHIWEDMSGKQGSLISPAMIREFMMPNYRKIKAFADAHGVQVISLDTDGNVYELVPLFMECGINLMFPFEVAAGCDINQYREKYPELCIMGGIDKREIAKGREAIDRELDRIGSMFESNGYIAAMDHLVPPEVSWDDFKYFVFKLKSMIGG